MTAVPGVRRFYSLSGLGEKILQICVKRVRDGFASPLLCDALPGIKLLFDGPYGKELVFPPVLPSTVVLIGTGTGLAPFRLLLQSLASLNFPGKVVLIAGAKQSATIPYLDDFRKLGDSLNLEIRLALSQESPAAVRRYVQDSFSIEEVVTWTNSNALIFICGGKEMGNSVIKKLVEAVGEEKVKEMKRFKRLRKEVY